MNQQPTTFRELWDTTVQTHPTRTFLLFEDELGTVMEWTYDEFDRIVDRVGSALAHRGVRRGSAVHMALRNCPAFIAVWLAAARLGAWIVPVDPASSARDISNQVERTQPELGICAAARAETYREGVCSDSLPIIELREDASDLCDGQLVAEPDSGPATERLPIASGDRLAVMFTSGTTSQPKGVELTQHNYAHVATEMSTVIGLEPENRWLVTLPLFHANAQYYCFAPAIAVGCSVALTAKFSASRWMQQAADLDVTHASLFAAPIRMILARRPQNTPKLALSHVWFAQSLGADHYEEFSELVGCRPRQLYGMTETVAAVTADTSDPLRHDVIGHPINGRTVTIADPDTFTRTAESEPGLLLVRGERGADLFAGYLNDRATTDKSFRVQGSETWFVTGDLVTMDTDGSLRFVGRADDVIKVAGENVSLTEIESVLAQAPGVLEAAVVSKADPIRDQVPIAFVVPRDPANLPDLAKLRVWASRNLSPAACPREWTLIDELPRTSVGKVRRFRITG